MIRLFTVMVENTKAPSRQARQNRTREGFAKVVFIALMSAMSGTVLGDQLTEGKALVMERGKGNCLACHMIADGKLPGNLGPPLVAMKARFPEAETLHSQIWDSTLRNPDSRMPPFGRHGILSREEVDLIVAYLYTL